MNNHDEEQFERRSDYRQQAERPHRHRGWKIFGWLVLLLAVLAGIYAFLAWHNVKVTTNQMFNSSGATRQRDAQKVLDQRRPVSILLLGTDTGALGRSYKGRTDTVMIMTINPQTQQTKIVSIPRDMKVNLPGYPEDSPAKINAAYTFGGVKETINVIQKHFNIPIDYYVLVNMGGLKQAINQVGGVTVTSPLTFDYEGSHFEKGESYHLNGTTALKFSRMRYDDPQGDYGRQQRQKLIIEALLKKSVSNKTVLNRAFLKSISHNSKTDLTFDDMLQLARHYRKATKNVSQDHAQGEGESSDGQAFEVVPQDEQQRISNLLRKSLGLDPANLDAEN
ncbi:LCP family protein [Limosilactobacillus antri]|uniref:Cell envelope-like function transcriptional attenuator common domain protein n=1 Tax=Limosilactobacillus antri DSM 16041 TaxID=525309 RepID=C8P4S3_9LACO|nr:LCP family protein [Limosilactobacillus antri]EEW54517.1 cell envelope-like function transcriptional attenuator common domain protein [Limosilactobacillus antri DSM 16041]KRK60173.1 transcriptional regulator [Limosilactobacillus antri DSM 16041]